MRSDRFVLITSVCQANSEQAIVDAKTSQSVARGQRQATFVIHSMPVAIHEERDASCPSCSMNYAAPRPDRRFRTRSIIWRTAKLGLQADQWPLRRRGWLEENGATHVHPNTPRRQKCHSRIRRGTPE